MELVLLQRVGDGAAAGVGDRGWPLSCTGARVTRDVQAGGAIEDAAGGAVVREQACRVARAGGEDGDTAGAVADAEGGPSELQLPARQLLPGM